VQANEVKAFGNVANTLAVWFARMRQAVSTALQPSVRPCRQIDQQKIGERLVITKEHNRVIIEKLWRSNFPLPISFPFNHFRKLLPQPKVFLDRDSTYMVT
jgi:hypothetical protein